MGWRQLDGTETVTRDAWPKNEVVRPNHDGGTCYEKSMSLLAECKDRQEAELDFISAAYTPEEAWKETSSNGEYSVFRVVKHQDVCLVVKAIMPPLYPEQEELIVSARVDLENTESSLTNVSHSMAVALSESCRSLALGSIGMEAILTVISHADEWFVENYDIFMSKQTSLNVSARDKLTRPEADEETQNILGRRLIYSHHIISKIKRGDIKSLAKELNLTRYMKIGWPGLLVIEGSEYACCRFYDEIRGWQWQYLVIRGEMQDDEGEDIDLNRRFTGFHEVDDMSIVANSCREAGLESLFKTSMKVYDAEKDDAAPDEVLYGVVVQVDHMNNGKAYRRWLRRTCREVDAMLVVKQVYPNDDFSKRPKILVAFIGEKTATTSILKKWRTVRVDEDSKGKPCLERRMSVAWESDFDHPPSTRIDWEDAASDNVDINGETLLELFRQIGGDAWFQRAGEQIRHFTECP